MRHIRAFVLALRIIGCIFCGLSALLTVQRVLTLSRGAVDSMVAGNIVFQISFFAPCAVMLLIGVICFIIAAIMRRKSK